MKAVEVSAFGTSEVLNLKEIAAPVANESEVLIEIHAAGVGRVDIMARQGLYALLTDPGFIPGIEIAGVILKTGHNVDKNWIGKRVFARTFKGGYAEQIAVPFSAVVEIPDAVSMTDAVALGVNALVADFSLRKAQLSEGSRLLIRGITGGIGTIATKLALLKKIDVTALLINSDKKAELEELGVTGFIYDGETSIYERSFDGVLDLVFGPGIDPFVDLLKDNSNYVISGGVGGGPEPDFGMSFVKRYHRSLSLHCFSLNATTDEKIRDSMSGLLKLAADGLLTPPIDKVFPLTAAREAHELLESGNVFGKVVLEVESK